MAEITDFGPRKTIFILAIVAGCFAVLWPKIFYPMLTASVNPHHMTDNSACCDVIFESDVTAADIMYEICQNILKHHQIDPRIRDALKTIKLTPQSASLCREEILARCGIDLSTFLAKREHLEKSYKQVLEEIRSFNSSLCLKINFGIPLSQLGTPHLIRYHILMPHNTIKQERRTPPHAGGLHPALRERGRAIPSSHIVPKVSDRPDHVVPKMRPPLGGAGHVVPAPKGSGTMGIIMPLYTLGIVLFFLYTIVKVLRKNSDSEIISEYPGAAAEKEFRKMVFSPEAFATAMTGGTMNYQKERSPSPQRPTPTLEELKDQAAGDIEIDQLRRRLVETEAAMERIVVQMGNISRSVMHSPNPQQEFKDNTIAQVQYSTADKVENIEHSPTIKVMGMEMTASCENKGSRPTTPIIPISPSHIEREKTPPKPIYLEGALPPQCELLVTDSETQAQKAEEDVEAPIVLSGKMTLSLISLDQNTAEIDEEDQEKNAKNIRILNSKDTAKVLSIKKNNKEEIENKDEIKEIYQGKQIEIEEEEQKKYLIQKRTEIKPIGYNEEKEKEEVQGVEETKEIEEIEEIEEDKEEVEQSEDEKKEEENDKAEIDRDDEENDKKINKIEQYNERSEEEVDKKEEEDEEEKEEEDEEEKEEKDEEEKEEKTEGRLEENEKEKENNNKNI
ncbi:calponin homology domain-containing protein DDB_G0272472-like isoform X1 [Apis dorsata]|uniref:calponin homology domain-containing protein DDB_G0272472-like isoform X1 n=1 Tax=Apis dorsata TaxID=7462 RepID=UPI0012938F7D|nr:calponin homology domain-containing protein DDB_G0272472-like isoform X1 [Apis dorsata]